MARMAVGRAHESSIAPAIYCMTLDSLPASREYRSEVELVRIYQARKAVLNSRNLQRESLFGALFGELERAESYSDNWDGYGAPKPDPSTAAFTRRLLVCSRRAGLDPATVVASAEGGIATYFMRDESAAYIEFKNSGEAVFAMYGRPDSSPNVIEIQRTEKAFESALQAIVNHLA